MKKLLLLLLSFAAITLNAQVYTHYFEGATAGEDLESLEDWFVTTKDGYNGGASPIFSDQDVLFYSDYIGSEMGISVEIDSANGGVGGDATRRYTSGWNVSGEDTLKLDASRDYIAADTFYAAFLVKPLGPDYGGMRDIFQLELSPSLGNWSRARVFMDISGDSDVQFGIGKKNGPINDGDTTETFVDGVGGTYLLVLAYQQVAGEDNDEVKLYVDPDPTKSAAEQTNFIVSPDLLNDWNSGDGVLPLRINITQRGHTAEIGCIRVGKDWKEVLQGPTAVTGVSLDQSTLSLDAGVSARLVATVMPEDAADPSVSWSSSDDAVAIVADGLVTAVAEGTATITVTTTDGSFTDDCAVTVNTAPAKPASPVYTHYFEGATAGEDLESLEDWFVTTKDGYNGGASPIFSDQDVLFYSDYIGSEMGISVEIDSANGGVGGDATRRYTSGWNVSGEDTLKLDASRDYIAADTFYAAFLVKPLGPDYGGMRDIFQLELSPSLGNWSRARVFMDISGDSDVQFGIGKKNGPINDGDTTETFVDGVGGTYLLVLAYQQAAGEDNDEVKLYVDPDPTKSAAEQTNFIVSPDLTNDWNSGDGVLPLRINITQRGHTAEIGCIRVGTDWKAVLQGPSVTGVSLDQSTLSVDVGATATLVATVIPEDAGDPSVSWSSSDDAVATVADGVVTGVAEGTATITVTTTDGSFTADCAVTVNAVIGIFGSSVAKVHIYPNPSTGAFTIGDSEGADVVVFNATGSVVFQKSNIDHNELINADLTKGIYFVSVTKDSDKRVAKLIIE